MTLLEVVSRYVRTHVPEGNIINIGNLSGTLLFGLSVRHRRFRRPEHELSSRTNA